jgi:Domain of unknown function (DUF4276)
VTLDSAIVTSRFRVLVDGESDALAVPKLLQRLDSWHGFAPAYWDPVVMRYKDERDLSTLKTLTSNDPDVSGALLLFDGDTEKTLCAASAGPELSRRAMQSGFNFPVAVVIAVQELEAWFLPCIGCLAGSSSPTRTGRVSMLFSAEANSPSNPESHRNCKGVLTNSMPFGRSYKEMTDAVRLAELVHIEHVLHGRPDRGVAGARSFASFVRAHQFLRSSNPDGATYPAPLENT